MLIRQDLAELLHSDRTVTGIHLYPNITFIEKGTNSDQLAPSGYDES